MVVVVVECEVEFCIGVFQCLDYVLQVFWVGGIGVVVWECVVDVGEVFDEFVVECFEQVCCEWVCDVVVGVDDEFQWLCEFYVVDDVCDVLICDVDCFICVVVCFELFVDDVVVQCLDLFVVDCGVVQYYFEVVVVGWVVVVCDDDV